MSSQIDEPEEVEDFDEVEPPTEHPDPNLAARVSLIERGYRIENCGISTRPSRDPLHRVLAPGGQPVGLIPDYGFRALLFELDMAWVIHDDWLGVTSDDGHYVEFLLSRFDRLLPLRRVESPRESCSSAAEGWHPNPFSTLYHDESRTTHSPYGSRRPVVLIHVGNGRGDCIEVSAPSARLYAVYAEHADRWLIGSPMVMNSIKIQFGEPSSGTAATEKARNLANAFMFEQAVMRKAAMQFHEPLVERKRVRPPRMPLDAATRFPPQFVDANASNLFVNAEQTSGRLSRYLACYQTVEYFLPFSDERESISRLKTEIFSPGFNLSNDRSLLNLVHIIGRQSAKTERESFRDLVNHVLTKEKAEKIYQAVLEVYPDAFSKRSKMKNLPFINPNDTTRTLAVQIADRVYGLRCRIVHSKAAGGSGGVEPLFPSDDEVEFLGPDLELVRLLAIDAVTAFAVANSMV